MGYEVGDTGRKSRHEIRDFKDLHVWQESMTLITQTYELARKLPRTEDYALKSQMCRAAVSIAANIAEGHGSWHRGVYLNHLSISRGSLKELETYILLLPRLNYASDEDVCPIKDRLRNVTMLLNALIRSLKAATDHE
jgi:four helix bundle protein